MKTQNQTTINDTLAILNAGYKANREAPKIRAAEAAAKARRREEAGLESARQNMRNYTNNSINSAKILYNWVKTLEEGTELTANEIFTTLKGKLTGALPQKSRASLELEIGHFLSAARWMGILTKEEGSAPYVVAANHKEALKEGIEFFKN